MISITIFKKNEDFVGFHSEGHAGYAKYGRDIVCAAVSVLVINTINSIEEFTSDTYQLDMEEDKGYIKLLFQGKPGPKSDLLIRSMILGLERIKKDYIGKYIHISYKEV